MWKFKKENPILKDWQVHLLENENVRKEEFIQKYGIDNISKMDKGSFEYSLKFHTKFSSSEQCDVDLGRTFEGVYEIDIPNADYLSHYLIYDNGPYYLFENKCGRADFTVSRIDESNLDMITYDEVNDRYTLNDDKIRRKSEYCFGIRLTNIEFIHEFLENLLGRKIEFKKEYKRGLKINQLLK
jgi:hypothetical protein